MLSKKLVLFDIDGTLIRHFGPQATINVGWYRFTHALKQVFNIDIIPTPENKYHGSVDRAILFDVAQKHGITKQVFDAKFNELKTSMIEYTQKHETKQIYEAIPDAVSLLHLVRNCPDKYFVGILTGNIDALAHWKLTHVGIDPTWFSLFVTSDEFEDRISLAKSVFAKVEQEAGIVVSPQNTYVIGDAVGDIRCAHAIGTTGQHQKDELSKEKPTLLVDSLMDERVFTLLGLKK